MGFGGNMKKYFKHNIKNVITVKNIITIEYLEVDASFVHQPEVHNFWELAYVDYGKMKYIVDNASITIKEGEIIFLAPQQKHEIHADPLISSNIFVLCFDCASPIIQMLKNMHFHLSQHEKQFLSNIISETQGTFCLPFNGKLIPIDNPNLGGEQVIKLYLELFIITMLRHDSYENHFVPYLSNHQFDNELCNNIIATMKTKLRSHISVSEICDSVAYSRTTISRIFKKITGKSLITYFNELKIEEAKKVIRESDLSINAISDILGFSDPRYFNYLFKQIVHITPKQYRNSIHKQTASYPSPPPAYQP